MPYGIALDIGTTTVSGSLVDLEKKLVLRRFSSLNSQISYGHDLVTRLNYARRKAGGLKRLSKSITSSINFIIANLLKNSGVVPDSISSIIAVGNAVMYHFLFSIPIDSFLTPPYRPHKTEKQEKDASGMGIKRVPAAKFILLPIIAGFIGSDAVSVMLATSLYKSEETILAMDIGTNGEIILGSREKIFVTSTAAGPAFEGWHITCGMRPVDGAIESAREVDGQLAFGVIGGLAPKGISGSGLIDLVSILLKRGEIEKTGTLKNQKFIVHKKITITQRDIREVQLAKSAFSVGTKFLKSKMDKDISRAYITGTFGNYINKENVKLLGLVPEDVGTEKIEFLEDGALRGVEKLLMNPALETDIKDILAKTEHVSLAEDKDFQREFISSMHF